MSNGGIFGGSGAYEVTFKNQNETQLAEMTGAGAVKVKPKAKSKAKSKNKNDINKEVFDNIEEAILGSNL